MDRMNDVGIERDGHWRVVWLDGKQIGRIRKRDNSSWYLQIGDEFVVYPQFAGCCAVAGGEM